MAHIDRSPHNFWIVYLQRSCFYECHTNAASLFSGCECTEKEILQSGLSFLPSKVGRRTVFIIVIIIFLGSLSSFLVLMCPNNFSSTCTRRLVIAGDTRRSNLPRCLAHLSRNIFFFLNDLDFLRHRLPRPYMINLTSLVFSAVEELWIFTTYYCVSASFLSVCEVTSASMLEWRFCGCEKTCVRQRSWPDNCGHAVFLGSKYIASNSGMNLFQAQIDSCLFFND